MNRPFHLGLTILEISKIVLHEFWTDYEKLKFGEEAKLYYMDTDIFVVYIKTQDIYSDFAKDIQTRFDTSNCELDSLLNFPLITQKR